jgi:hypothetical protein
VKACEKASIATMRPISGGTAESGGLSSANNHVKLNLVDFTAVNSPQSFNDARISIDLLEPCHPGISHRLSIVIV